jgi:hypothetical protein
MAGTIQADSITNSSGSGAPTFPYGINTGFLGIRYGDITGMNATTTPSIISFATLDYDTGVGSPNFSSGTFTVPTGQQGFYEITCKIAYLGTNVASTLYIYKNGSSFSTNISVASTINIADTLKLAVGDTIQIYISAGSSEQISTTAGLNALTIKKLGSY